MSIKDFFSRIFRDNAVTSETLEAEALAILRARPGDVIPIKDIGAHIRAGTLTNAAMLRVEPGAVIDAYACTAPVYTYDASGFLRRTYKITDE